MKRRVVVTGLGIVSCLGRSFSRISERLRAGTSGIQAVPEWGELGLKSRVGALAAEPGPGEEPPPLPKRLQPALSEVARECCRAALKAVAGAAVPPDLLSSPRSAAIVGSGAASPTVLATAVTALEKRQVRRIPPGTILQVMASNPSAAVANVLGIGGRSYAVSSACATSAHAIGHAYELIRDGHADLAVAGGGEEIGAFTVAAFEALRLALAKRFNDAPERASRPFDRDRDGFVVGGGAGIVILEALETARARGAPLRAEVAGFAANSDGYDLVLPEPSGQRVAACIEAALADAGVEPGEVDYINAHATGTVAGDVAEAAGLRLAFGGRVPAVSSTKSFTGHALGAAGAHELIYCLAMLEGGFIAPSINVDHPDPAVADLPLVTAPVSRRLEVVVSNSFGFGGTNGVLVLRRLAG